MQTNAVLDLELMQDKFAQVTANCRNLRLGERLQLSNGRVIKCVAVSHGPGMVRRYFVGEQGKPMGRRMDATTTKRSASEAAKQALEAPSGA